MEEIEEASSGAERYFDEWFDRKLSSQKVKTTEKEL